MPAVLLGTLFMAFAGGFDGMLPPRATGAEDEVDEEPAPPKRTAARRFGAPAVSQVKAGKARRLSQAHREANPEIDYGRMALCGAVVLAIIILAATDLVSIDVGALSAVIILIGSDCVTVEEAYDSVDGRVMVAIACSFGVSVATNEEHTKVAGLVASSIVKVFEPFGPTGVLAAVCIIACVVGSVISNNAAALLLYPIVVDLSETTEGLVRRQAVLVLMVACSASFLTPISFQTNLMVMGPGRYEFLDFLRFGAGLQVLTMVTIVTVASIFNEQQA